jgi:hypothetical protein
MLSPAGRAGISIARIPGVPRRCTPGFILRPAIAGWLRAGYSLDVGPCAVARNANWFTCYAESVREFQPRVCFETLGNNWNIYLGATLKELRHGLALHPAQLRAAITICGLLSVVPLRGLGFQFARVAALHPRP